MNTSTKVDWYSETEKGVRGVLRHTPLFRVIPDMFCAQTKRNLTSRKSGIAIQYRDAYY